MYEQKHVNAVKRVDQLKVNSDLLVFHAENCFSIEQAEASYSTARRPDQQSVGLFLTMSLPQTASPPLRT